jgi:dipeptidase D
MNIVGLIPVRLESSRLPNKAVLEISGIPMILHVVKRAKLSKALDRVVDETVSFFNSYGYSVSKEEKYPSWSPDMNSFTTIVNSAMEEIFGESKTVAIHAGLECGVIAKKYPNIKFASIGPTIEYPHSKRERLKIDSVDRTMEVIKRVIDEVN